MNKGSTLFFFLTFYSIHYSFSQALLVKQWDNRFGGFSDDGLFAAQQTLCKGFILGGTSFSDAGGDKSQSSRGNGDYWIVKADSIGSKQWDVRFGGTDNDYLFSVNQTSDSGYVIGGASTSSAGGDRTEATYGGFDYWIVKMDSLGNKQWDKRYGGTDDDWLFAVKQTTDGGYILGGSSFSGIGGDKTENSRGNWDYWILKTDAAGNKQWDKCFGGSDDDFFYSLEQTADGGFILGGTSYSPANGDKTQSNQGISDYWIVKVDPAGNLEWDNRFGGNYSDDFYTIRQTLDGGYVLGGLSSSDSSGDKTQWGRGLADYWIVKTDAIGNKQWDKEFGGTDEEAVFGNIVETADTGYVIAGASYSSIGGDKSETNLGPEQTWIVKIDSVGNKLWDKTIFVPGNSEAGFVFSVEEGCYVVANFTNGGAGGYKSQSSQGGYDYWIAELCFSTSITLPVSHFVASDTALCSASSKCISFNDQSTGAPASWHWLFPGASPDFSDQQNPSDICYYEPGTYSVSLIVTNAACSDTLSDSALIVVGSVCPPDFTIYPNPAHNEVFISNLSAANSSLSIYDVLGQRIAATTTISNVVIFNESKASVNIENLAAGIYFIRLESEGKDFVGKFIKE